MDNLYFKDKQEKSSKKKAVITAVALIAIVGVVATFAVYSAPSDTVLREFQLEEAAFQSYMLKYNKVYASAEEYQTRFNIFRDNAAYTRIHNSQGHSWSLGVNQFADLSFAEFKAIYTPNSFEAHQVNAAPVPELDLELPATVDWRTQGAVTDVKNQGQCGSCWAFSTTGSVEGAWFLAGHTLTSLSEQELVDCSDSFGNQGCNGGLMTSAFKYVAQFGLATEAAYPYQAKNGKCNTTVKNQVAAKISNFTNVATESVPALQAAVAQQPVSVAVEADQSAWQLYTGGVVTANCGTALDHGVLIVGYNTSTSPPYWIVKNSWGASWGEQGFIRIAIHPGKGICGINMTPSYPTSPKN